MGYLELLLLSIGLCFDTFAVSLTGGICTRKRMTVRQILKIIFCFGLFQGGFIFIGWLLGISFSEYISEVDHWVAFALLGYCNYYGISNNLPCCTGAEKRVVLGKVTHP